MDVAPEGALNRWRMDYYKHSAPNGADPVIISQTADSFPRISEIIARGGIIAFRTDSFYGLGADPFNRKAVQRIKQLKGREENKPILIVISDWEAVGRFIAEPTPAFQVLAQKLWPGPLTLIGSAVSGVPKEITAGTKTVGVRLPGDDRVRALVEACAGALTATSANPSREEPATTAQKVFDYFADAIDLIVDDGNATTDQPSTVVDACDVEPWLIREGAIAWSAVQKVLNKNTFKSI
jgi:L-threonylcarbamoyladenylate synthase